MGSKPGQTESSPKAPVQSPPAPGKQKQESDGLLRLAMAAQGRNAGVLALFDVDDTLTAPRKVPRVSLESIPGVFSFAN